MKTRIQVIELNDGTIKYIPEYKEKIRFISCYILFMAHVASITAIVGATIQKDCGIAFLFTFIYIILFLATIIYFFDRWRQYNIGISYHEVKYAQNIIDKDLLARSNEEKEIYNKKVKSTKFVKYP